MHRRDEQEISLFGANFAYRGSSSVTDLRETQELGT